MHKNTFNLYSTFPAFCDINKERKKIYKRELSYFSIMLNNKKQKGTRRMIITVFVKNISTIKKNKCKLTYL